MGRIGQMRPMGIWDGRSGRASNQVSADRRVSIWPGRKALARTHLSALLVRPSHIPIRLIRPIFDPSPVSLLCPWSFVNIGPWLALAAPG